MILGIEVVHVRNQVLYNIHMWQWVDLGGLAQIGVNFAIMQKFKHHKMFSSTKYILKMCVHLPYTISFISSPY